MFKFFKELVFGKKEVAASDAAPYKMEAPTLDASSHPSWHTAPPPETAPIEIKDVLDVNGDGKVNLDDVKAVVKKTRKPKAEAQPVKKPRGRKPATAKPAAKKAPAKKPGRKPAAMTAKSKKV